MLGIYIFSAIVGVGLLLFSVFAGDTDSDASDIAVHTDVDMDVGADVGTDVDVHTGGGFHFGVGDVVLGLFRPRNLTFLLAAFGSTGALLTWTGADAATTLMLAVAMGVGSWFLTHVVFTWLKRTDSGVAVMNDRALEGLIARVTLPIAPGSRGRITIVAAGRQTYLTARLEPGVDRPLGIGTEVLIRRTANGVAEVIPTDTLELPPTSS